jgi:hypothetical protein
VQLGEADEECSERDENNVIIFAVLYEHLA